jgi:hypothetical protein
VQKKCHEIDTNYFPKHLINRSCKVKVKSSLMLNEAPCQKYV